MADIKKLNDQELDNIAGGIGGTGLAAGSVSGTGIASDGVSGTGIASDSVGGYGIAGWKWVVANVKTGYLALRSAPSYDYRNEIAKIVDGTAFQINPAQTSGDYAYARFNGMEGWVNSKYVSGLK